MKINYFFRKYPSLFFIFLAMLFVGIEGSFTFCSKSVCPGFTDAYYDQWFPYTTGQQIVFATLSGKADTVKIGSAEKSQPFSSYNACGSSYASVRSDSGSTFFYVNAYNNGNTQTTIMLDSFETAGIAISDTGIVTNAESVSIPPKFLSSVTLNGKTFSDVQLLSKDTIYSSTNIYKVWMARNKGLVAYQKRIANELFIRQ